MIVPLFFPARMCCGLRCAGREPRVIVSRDMRAAIYGVRTVIRKLRAIAVRNTRSEYSSCTPALPAMPNNFNYIFSNSFSPINILQMKNWVNLLFANSFNFLKRVLRFFPWGLGRQQLNLFASLFYVKMRKTGMLNAHERDADPWPALLHKNKSDARISPSRPNSG